MSVFKKRPRYFHHLIGFPIELRNICLQAKMTQRGVIKTGPLLRDLPLVLRKTDLKNGVYVLDCSQHRKEAKITRKKGDWVRPASKTNAMDCPFRLRNTWQEDCQVWQQVTCNLEHSHAMCPDSFVFIQHRERDPDR